MTADYLQKSAGSLNTIFQLYKAKLRELPDKPEPTDERELDRVSAWWSDICHEFDAISQSDDEDVENFSMLFSLACIEDLQCKYLSKGCTKHRYIDEKMDMKTFEEYLTHAEKGDYVTVNGVHIEVKRVD